MSQTPESARAEGFAALEDDVIELCLMSDVALTLIEDHIGAKAQGGFLTVRYETVRMVDFAIGKVVEMARAIDQKWREAHKRACEIERSEDLAVRDVTVDGAAARTSAADAAPEPDPFLAFVRAWDDAERVVGAATNDDAVPAKLADELHRARVSPFGERAAKGTMPLATTAEGAAAALHKIIDLGDIGRTTEDLNLLLTALAYLEERAPA